MLSVKKLHIDNPSTQDLETSQQEYDYSDSGENPANSPEKYIHDLSHISKTIERRKFKPKNERQEKNLAIMKKYSKINPCLHELLEEMPTYLFRRVSKDLLLFHQEPEKITEFLFDHIEAWKQRKKKYKKERYLLSRKSTIYIRKFLQQYFDEEKNSFQEINSESLLGEIPALQFCVNTIIAFSAYRQAFRKLLDKYNIQYPNYNYTSKIATWTNWEEDHKDKNIIKTPQELLILFAAMEIA